MNDKTYDLLVYHESCSDGITAAWIANRGAKINKIISIHPGKSIDLIDNSKILFVDVCPDINNLLKLIELKNDITIMDHHVTNKELLENIKGVNVIYDINKSGCQIVFDELIGGKRFWFVDYIGDRDLWTWKLPYSKEVNAGLFYSGLIDLVRLDELLNCNENEKINELKIFGEKILDQINKDIENSIKYASLTKFIGTDYIVFLVTCKRVLRSDVGNILVKYTIGEIKEKYNLICDIPEDLKNKKVDFSAVWYYDFVKDEWLISLRGADHSPDLSSICKNLGGGGHKHAAGFIILNGRLTEKFELLKN